MESKDNASSISKNTLSEIRHQFFSFRNGDLAESLKRNGAPFKTVFGLLLPQIKQISEKEGKNKQLASELWNEDCRESRLLAIYIFPPEELNLNEAENLVKGLKTSEEAEILPFVLLKRLPYAKDLLLMETQSDDLPSLQKYCLTMLSRNLGI